MFSLAIGTAMFATYRTFKDPDVRADRELALHTLRIVSLESSIVKLVTNDIPHIDAKIEALAVAAANHDRAVAENFAKVFTILEERVPRK